MYTSILGGLWMADDVPTGDKALFAFFEMMALAFAFEGTAAWLHNESLGTVGKAYGVCVGLFIAGIIAPKFRRKFAAQLRLGKPWSIVLLTVSSIAALASLYYSITKAPHTPELLVILGLIIAVGVLAYIAFGRPSDLSPTATPTNRRVTKGPQNADQLVWNWKRMVAKAQNAIREEKITFAQALVRDPSYSDLRPYLRKAVRDQIEGVYVIGSMRTLPDPTATVTPFFTNVSDEINRIEKERSTLSQHTLANV